MYYRGAQAAIVVYDILNQDSFQRAQTWVNELQRKVRDGGWCGWIEKVEIINLWFLSGVTKYRDRVGGQQGGFGQQSNGRVRGGETVRGREWTAFHGDVRQDGAERKRDLLGDR